MSFAWYSARGTLIQVTQERSNQLGYFLCKLDPYSLNSQLNPYYIDVSPNDFHKVIDHFVLIENNKSVYQRFDVKPYVRFISNQIEILYGKKVICTLQEDMTFKYGQDRIFSSLDTFNKFIQNERYNWVQTYPEFEGHFKVHGNKINSYLYENRFHYPLLFGSYIEYLAISDPEFASLFY